MHPSGRWMKLLAIHCGRSFVKHPGISVLSLAVATGLWSTAAWSANGNVITVDSLADGSLPDACTLRDALKAAASEEVQGGCVAGQPGQDEILITASGTLLLTQGTLMIESDVIITGPGTEELIISGGFGTRIFRANGSFFGGNADNLVFTDMTLTNVGPDLPGGGAIFLNQVEQTEIERLVIRDGSRGGISIEGPGQLRVLDTTISNTTRRGIDANLDADGGVLQLDNVTLTGNGAGLWCRCDLRITNSTISGNGPEGNGGGVETYLSRVYIADTVISGNISTNVGGLYLNVYEMEMRRVTIAGNSGSLAGGMLLRPLQAGSIVEGLSVIDNQASGLGGPAGPRGVGGVLVNTRPLSDLSIVNSTISGNTGTRAGGIDFDDNASGETRFEHLTVANNLANSPLAIAGGLSFRVNQAGLGIANSIFAGNGAPQGLGDDVVAWTRDGLQDPIEPGSDLNLSYSLVEDDSGFAALGIGNLLGVGAQLGPLADNGGPTLTHLPLPGSPVLNAGDPDFEPPPEFDQRGPGFPRVLSGRVDMGAVEADFDLIFSDRFQLP